MQIQTKDADSIQSMASDISILNKRKFTCLGHIYLLKLEIGELDYHPYPSLNPDVKL